MGHVADNLIDMISDANNNIRSLDIQVIHVGEELGFVVPSELLGWDVLGRRSIYDLVVNVSNVQHKEKAGRSRLVVGEDCTSVEIKGHICEGVTKVGGIVYSRSTCVPNGIDWGRGRGSGEVGGGRD